MDRIFKHTIGQACEAAPAIIVEGIMKRIAAIAIIALCTAAPAVAFGTGGDGSVGGFIGPLIMLEHIRHR